MKNVITSGPFLEYSSPYGNVHSSLNRHVWYVSKKLEGKELKEASPLSKMMGEKCLGKIIRFDKNPRRYIIDQLYPQKSLSSLKKAVDFLVENDGKLVFCS